MLKLKKEIKYSAEQVEATCILMNSFKHTLKLKLIKLKEEMYQNDFKIKRQFKVFPHIRLQMQENKAQLDHPREQDHQKNTAQKNKVKSVAQ